MRAIDGDIADWALALLRCPDTGRRLTRYTSRLVRDGNVEVGRVENGVVRIPVLAADDNVRTYRQLGGPHFWERAGAGYAMSALDTPNYHAYLRDMHSASTAGIVVDVGGGDGRNARPWLEMGCRRVIVVDAVADALMRFRNRINANHPEWLDRVLLIEADARKLPLARNCADAVLAIESLYYLNEDYEVGLRECKALLKPGGRLLLSERDYEGGLLLRLLYNGIGEMLESSQGRTVIDGPADAPMRTRCFTEGELVDLLKANGLTIESIQGMSLFSVVLGWMRNNKLLHVDDDNHLPAVSALLGKLGRQGRMRRCHVVVATPVAH